MNSDYVSTKKILSPAEQFCEARLQLNRSSCGQLLVLLCSACLLAH